MPPHKVHDNYSPSPWYVLVDDVASGKRRWGKPRYGLVGRWPCVCVCVCVCVYMSSKCDTLQVSNSVLPVTCPHWDGTRHWISLFGVIMMISVDVWKDDHCVSAYCCRSWVCTRILAYYALRSLSWMGVNGTGGGFDGKSDIFLCLDVAGISVKVGLSGV